MSAVQNAPDDVVPQGRAWMIDANCRGLDTELFFPHYGSGGYAGKQAKRICAACPVQVQCGEYADVNRIGFGIWNGRNRSPNSVKTG